MTEAGAPNAASAAAEDWRQRIRVGFDLETTGRDPTTARVVTASLVMVDPEGNLRAHAEWLVDPGVPIPEESTAVHGVSTEQAQAEGLPAAEALKQIGATLAEVMEAGMPVVAFNAVYDFTVLDRELARHGLEPVVPRGVLDPFVMDKQVDRFRKGKRTLTDVCALYGVALLEAHTSAADSLAAVCVADVLVAGHAQLRLSLDQLFAAQQQWKAAQSASFQEYLRRRDPAAVVNGDWPIQRS